ncbi:MAG TPA: sigma-70 family RNA polymerase sigma factor [Acidimicrobiales bacterium]|nr:sigma-70 family RNA polymerase sigma factor [Acidimicrobiales bacterium]
MRDSVGQYLHEIGLVPLLNAAQERELSQKVEAGRDAQAALDAAPSGRAPGRAELKRTVREAARARDYFIRANLRLVVSIARRYPLPPGMDLLDLIQEGNLGLEHAVEKFDWRKGFKFSTYATFWIRQAIGRALDQKANLVRLPSERSAQLRAALRAVSGEGDDLDPDLANLHRLATPTSLDRTVGEDGEQELVDLLPDSLPGPEQIVVDQLQEEMVTSLLDRLEPRARVAVEHRFGLADGQKHSFREVGEVLGVTAEAARRIVKRAVDELKLDAEAIAAA